jgi:hypothetical protein
MVDHLMRAKDLRARATKCELAAKESKSEKFSDCYRLLSKHYEILAILEEEFLAREIARTSNTYGDQFRDMIAKMPT